MQTYPRALYFKMDRCVGVGFGGDRADHDKMVIMLLPSDHYDFIGYIECKGKTQKEIEAEVKRFLN
jgi:hypothetical protein